MNNVFEELIHTRVCGGVAYDGYRLLYLSKSCRCHCYPQNLAAQLRSGIILTTLFVLAFFLWLRLNEAWTTGDTIYFLVRVLDFKAAFPSYVWGL